MNILGIGTRFKTSLDRLFTSSLSSKRHTDFFQENGYLILKHFFSTETLNRSNEGIEMLWNSRRRKENPVVIDIFIGTENERRVYFRDAPDEAKKVPHKINDLFLEYEWLRELCLDRRLTSCLEGLVHDEPFVCNTLSLEFGSQQDYHVDTLYMPSSPNGMVASWIALEDIVPDSGPLQFYPRSHRIPPYLFSHGKRNAITEEMESFKKYYDEEISERNLEPATFIPNAGDVFIWHEQLYHGGAKILNPQRTRRSLVTHYFRVKDFLPNDIVRTTNGGAYMRRSHQKVP